MTGTPHGGAGPDLVCPITEKENRMALAIQGSIWLGAGVTLVMLLSRRRKRRTIQ